MKSILFSIVLLLLLLLTACDLQPETPPCVNCCSDYSTFCNDTYTYSCLQNASLPDDNCYLNDASASVCNSFTNCYWGINDTITTCYNYSSINELGISNITYAEVFYHSYTTPLVITISAADTYYNITGFEYGIVNGFTNTTAYNTIVMKNATYKVCSQASFSGGNSGEYEFELHKNDIPLPHCAFFRSTSTNNLGNAMMCCLENFKKNDELTMRIKDISAPAQSINLYQLNFNIVEVS